MSDVLTLTESQKSLEQLLQIQTQAPPSPIRNLPTSTTVYDIDLNTRTVEAPRILSVSRDHKSTVIYFRVDRYYDYMDLAETVCLIQYYPAGNNKTKVPFTYVVPFFDILSNEDTGKIIFPWVIGGPATKEEGNLQFAIRFYKVDTDETGKPVLTYNLNTSPVSSKILYGLEVDDEAMKIEYDEPIADLKQFENLIHQISDLRTKWTIL